MRRLGLPRMRGDRPGPSIEWRDTAGATPHARGSTRWPDARARRLHGYPACAGIDPRLAHTRTFRGRLPRMRGDRPFIAELQALAAEATPHARGSTLSPCVSLLGIVGYPACAGIDLGQRPVPWPSSGLPRMRGDRPGLSPGQNQSPQATPHARGSTFAHIIPIRGQAGYPACAGIDLQAFFLAW